MHVWPTEIFPARERLSALLRRAAPLLCGEEADNLCGSIERVFFPASTLKGAEGNHQNVSLVVRGNWLVFISGVFVFWQHCTDSIFLFPINNIYI